MARYFSDRLVQVGLTLLIVGTGPLLGVVLVARLGFTQDPDPNPVFLGMLAGFTFWPALILIAIGAWRVGKEKA